ncbi:MAG: deoxyribonuclease V [Candidatus Eiseniibacteriota bacterium]|jgi:deoxyribonuclease V
MRIRRLHRWDLTPREAVAVQRRLRGRVESRDRLPAIRTVAGLDVGFDRRGGTTRAAVAVLQFPSLEPCDEAVVVRRTCFPYVPGLLSFREVPPLLDALAALRRMPDLLLCDGQGLAHPRRLGLACHLGLVTDTPSIGVAKSRLVGTHDPLPARRGAMRPLHDGGEQIGVVLRTRTGVKPLYVSVGHRIALETAVRLVLAVTPRFRLPETTRRAHRLASG